MGWDFDLNILLEQDDFRQRYIDHVTNFGNCNDPQIPSRVVRNTWLWYAIYSYALSHKEDLNVSKSICFVRHEDLCVDPINKFREIFSFVGVPFNEVVKSEILKQTSGETTYVESGAQHQMVRDSQKTATLWMEKLPKNISQWICETTAHVAQRFYPESKWRF